MAGIRLAAKLHKTHPLETNGRKCSSCVWRPELVFDPPDAAVSSPGFETVPFNEGTDGNVFWMAPIANELDGTNCHH